MKTLSEILNKQRKEYKLKLKELSATTGIDMSLLSKYEHGERIPTEEHLDQLILALKINPDEVRILWLTEKVWQIVQYEHNATEVLFLAESRAAYLNSKQALNVPDLSVSIREKIEIADTLKKSWEIHKPMNITQLQKMQEYYNLEYTFESNRIEGNTLTLQETHLVVNEGITIGGKSMREHLEAINHAEAVSLLYEWIQEKEQITRRNVLDLHSLILKGIDKENAGRYRSVPVRITGSKHEPPQPYMLDKLMEDYFLHYLRQKNTMYPVILAAEMHERLVTIHPFIDGNGRTARLVMNLILLQNGFTLTQLKGDPASRLKYYQALEKVQVDNDPEAFYLLVLDAAIVSLQEHLKLAGINSNRQLL